MSTPPFIEVHPVGGNVMYVNKQHIVGILRGGNSCFLRIAYSNAAIPISESYEELKTKLRD